MTSSHSVVIEWYIEGLCVVVGRGRVASRLGEEIVKHWQSLLHQSQPQGHSVGEWASSIHV